MTRLLAPAIALVSAALLLPITTVASGAPVRIGTGSKACTLGPKANCKGVKARWGVRFHGNLKGINLQGADLTGADLRGSNLSGADIRGARFDHADLTEANLSRVKAGPRPGARKRATATASCWPNCQGAQFNDSSLTYANLAGGNFTDASFELASLMHSTLSTAAAPGIYDGASFYDAGLKYVTATYGSFQRSAASGNVTDFMYADLVYASLGGSNFTSANFTVADLAGSYFKDTSVNPPVYWITTGATWDNTVCSNGTTSSTGC
jgi:uncharacterized protein YjbI with pentapeptide repeats